MKHIWINLIILGTIMLLTACTSPSVIPPTPTSQPPATRIATATALPTASSTPIPPPASTAAKTILPSQTTQPQPTNTRKIVVIATYTRTTTPTTQVVSCPGAPLSQLQVKDWAMVSIEPPLPNNVRSEPVSSSQLIGRVQPGEILQITAGPRCADGYTWWYIQSEDELKGWTAEGDADGYWIVPLQPVVDWATAQNTVVLTTRQVRSAVDIESAIQTATARGTRPGVVILDGQGGPFVYTQADRSINIFVSNLALVGINRAVIQGCGDGLFFDNFPLKNILVEGIEFVCEGHGITTSSAFDSVIVRNNIFRTGLAGIMMGGASSSWLITGNKIETESNGIEITAGKNFTITENDITGNTAVLLRQCYDFQVRDNTLWGIVSGVQLIQKAARNLIDSNMILGVSLAGIQLETGVTDNLILENSVTCAPGMSCKTVEASNSAVEANTIQGNTP